MAAVGRALSLSRIFSHNLRPFRLNSLPDGRMMVTGRATGPGGGGGYMLLAKNVPPLLPPPPRPRGLRAAPGWDCGCPAACGGPPPPPGCVVCASWQTSVTKSEKVSWPPPPPPFSWYLASVVGLCGPPLSAVDVVAVAEEVQTTGL